MNEELRPLLTKALTRCASRFNGWPSSSLPEAGGILPAYLGAGWTAAKVAGAV
jgi:hypothetical protein